MRIMLRASVALLVSLTFAASPATGQVHAGVTDAGDSLGTALKVSNGIIAIEGAFDASFRDIDMYRVCLTGGQTFSASTLAEDWGYNPLGSRPRLMLFDAEGRGVYFNQRADATFVARLPAGHELTPTASGIYHLVVATSVSALDGNNQMIFDEPIFTVAILWTARRALWRLSLTGKAGQMPVNAIRYESEGVPPVLRQTLMEELRAAHQVAANRWRNFLPPINQGQVNSVKAGQTIPVRQTWVAVRARECLQELSKPRRGVHACST